MKSTQHGVTLFQLFIWSLFVKLEIPKCGIPSPRVYRGFWYALYNNMTGDKLCLANLVLNIAIAYIMEQSICIKSLQEWLNDWLSARSLNLPRDLQFGGSFCGFCGCTTEFHHLATESWCLYGKKLHAGEVTGVPIVRHKHCNVVSVWLLKICWKWPGGASYS